MARKKSQDIDIPAEAADKPWKPGLFDFMDSVGNSKRDLLVEDPAYEKDYSPWMMNVGFSLDVSTILYANEMNTRAHLTKKMQHDFYLHAVPSKRRFNKWPKKVSVQEDIQLLSRYLGCSVREASRMIGLLSEADLLEVREGTFEGGLDGKKTPRNGNAGGEASVS